MLLFTREARFARLPPRGRPTEPTVLQSDKGCAAKDAELMCSGTRSNGDGKSFKCKYFMALFWSSGQGRCKGFKIHTTHKIAVD